MRMKTGKELTQLEIIKRLNLMGVKYDSNIMGKNYYINLYNKEVLLPENQLKIKNELEKDRKYLEYLTNNLRTTKEVSFEYNLKKKDISSKNKKYFFSDFNAILYMNALLYCNSLNFIEENHEIIRKNIKIPINAFKKFSSALAYPDINNAFKTFLNYIYKITINFNAYHYVYIIIFVCLLIILLSFCKKCRKEKRKKLFY